MASGDSVQQIKDRLNIIDVVTPYVELHKAGRHFKGKSPFTNEKTPSFFVSPDRGMYYCFSTSQGGDIFKFIEVMEGVTFKEALKILAAKAGVELVPEDPQKRGQRDQLYAAVEAACKYFETSLLDNATAQAYLTKRGVKKETIKKWRIGYAPGPPEHGWRELRQHLAQAGFSDDIMQKAGLIKRAENGKEPFDVFRDRIMFPLRDQNGRVVAFSGRILAKDSDAPKYVNSPETELYHKSELLYGYDFAKHGIRDLKFWLVVEGQFDVVMSHQAGYSTTVAVSGTALTLHHVQMLERLSTNVVLGLDADRAGIAAMKRGAELMLSRGMDVKVATFPDGADPADMVVSDPKSFKHSIGKAIHIIEFLLAHLRSTHADERSYKLHVRDEVLPFILLIPNRIDQEHFEKVIAVALDTTHDAIRYEVERLKESAKKTATPQSAKQLVGEHTPTKISRLETALLQVLAAYEVVDESYKNVIQTIFTEVIERPIGEVALVQDQAELQKAIFQFEQSFEKMTKRAKDEELVFMLNSLRQESAKDKLAAARNELGEPGVDNEALLERILILQKRLQMPPYQTDILNTV